MKTPTKTQVIRTLRRLTKQIYNMKNKKAVTPSTSSTSRKAVKRFKDGDKVTYEGSKFTIKKAYEYKGRRFAILTNKDVSRLQVSINSLK